MRTTFQVKCQGHRINELKPFSYIFLVVLSLFNICTYIIKPLEQCVVKSQVHSTNALKSIFLAQVVISCYIADFNVFLNKSNTVDHIMKKYEKCWTYSINCKNNNKD